MRSILFTGGPGSGKTTLLSVLEARGYPVVGDSARSIIRDRVARGLSPRPSPAEFAREILQRDIENFVANLGEQGPVLFDRGIVDALGMLHEAQPLPESELAHHLARYPYHPTAFVLPPWEAIYAGDSERDQTFAEAERVHKAATDWYRRCGYACVEVPIGTVEERCAFVLRHLPALGDCASR